MTERSEARGYLLLLLPAILVLLALFVYPLLGIADRSVYKPRVGYTLDYYAQIWRVPVYLTVIWGTFQISALVTLFSLALGYPLAYLLATLRPRVAQLLMIVVILPFFTSIIVRTYAWMLLLSTEGMINTLLKSLGIIDTSLTLMYTRLGVVIALVQFAMPVMIILLATAISHVNTDYEKAAANLGASPGRVFWRVTVPLTMPGIIAGFIVICAWTMSAFATPQLIGGGKILMISNVVYLTGFSALNFPFAATMSVVALVSALGALAVMKAISTRIERRTALHS